MFPLEFLFFGAILIGVAVSHRHALRIAALGAASIATYKMLFSPFPSGGGVSGFVGHLAHEWVVLLNLLFLLLGFALLARHFEDTGIPSVLPRWLPDNWLGGFALLALVFLLSGFLDNIAAAMIGGAVAHTVFRGKVHVAYLVGLVAASNAGGAGSVIGDTTTTMMWIAGVPAKTVLEAYVASGVALVVFGIPAAVLQQRHSPIQCDPPAGLHVDWTRTAVVAVILLSAVAVNVLVNTRFHEVADRFPFLGVAVAGGILLTAPLRRPQWSLLAPAFTGAAFLLSLVLCASMMPVERLPTPSWQTSLGLGFLSAVFDNIPLTALALKQGGYDWGFLAFAVGFGGSMIWFGSSAGVALTSQYPEGRSVFLWLRHGWFVVVAYVIGFATLLLTLGYHPVQLTR
jgi:Na+/H+ antiporter NhaD/arsenite permease-like protein